MSAFGHIPVLLDEVVSLLAPEPGGVYVDCTAGLGGHASAIARHLGPSGSVVLNDLDAGNLERAAATVAAAMPGIRVLCHRGNFAALPRFVQQQGLRATCVLADLGFASPQVDDASRGLSFTHDGPLDMRLDPAGPVTAAMLIATLNEEQLTQVIRDYGEEKHARAVAQRIISARAQSPITTTGQLAAICGAALSGKNTGGIHPATRTFQAIRIAVNDEMGNLDGLLDELSRGAASAASAKPTWLAPGARAAMISFHSLEDRPVKQAFAAMTRAGLAREVSDGVVTPSESEERANPRSRSAKLRVIRVKG